MSGRSRVHVIALLGLLAGCLAAREDLDPRFVAVHNAFAALGMTSLGAIQHGSLAQGRERRLRLELPAECVTVVTLGGAGVRDVDVVLLDDHDAPAGRDATRDAEASVRICPEHAGAYTAIVKMVEGEGDFVVAAWVGGSTTKGVPAGPAAGESAAGTCDSPILLGSGVTHGNTRMGEGQNVGSCAASTSSEVVYSLAVPRRQRVVLEVDPHFDSVMYVRKENCQDGDGEIACNDDAAPPSKNTGTRGSRIDEVLDPGTYFVFVDGYNTEVGTFKLDVSMTDVPSLADACQRRRSFAGTMAGTLAGAFDGVRASCGAEGRGPDVAYRFDVPQRSRVRLRETSKDFSPVVHVRRQCTDDQSTVGCADSGIAPEDATFTGVVEAGSYTVFADSQASDARGAFSLEAEQSPTAGRPGLGSESCASALPASDPLVGDTFEAVDDVRGKCSADGAPDLVYRLEVKGRARLTARIGGQESTHALSLRRSCDATGEVACGTAIDQVVTPGTWFLAVDGKDASSFGRFNVPFKLRGLAAQDNACRAPALLTAGQRVTGTTVGAGDRFVTSCAGREETQGSPDRIYRIVLTKTTKIEVSLETPAFDGVLAIRRACGDPDQGRPTALEAACNNDHGDAHHSGITTTLGAGTYFVVVDGHQTGNEGAFTLDYRVLK